MSRLQQQRKNRLKRTPSTITNSEETHEEKPEPYHCKGRFLEDFDALCRQAQVTFIVPVVQRPHPPSGIPLVTSAAPDVKDKAVTKTAKGVANKEREVSTAQHPHSEIEGGESVNDESLPKTYSLRENYEYFKPKIQVEMDNPEKQDTLTEILIRAWKVDRFILDVFAQTFPTLERLTTLHFWHTGLTDETISQLASLLPKCPSVRILILDSNPLPLERYDVLFTDDTLPFTNLSLRHCRITERGAELIAKGLGTERRQNTKLQTLNLAYNLLGDKGAEHLARGLKFNRTLLVLNLSSNDIGDRGAQQFAEILSKFPLTQEELIYRRQLLLHSAVPESMPNLLSGRRRNSLTASPTAAGPGRKKSGATNATVQGKGKGTAGATAGKADTKDTGKAPKKDEKPLKKAAMTVSEPKLSKAGGKSSSDKLSKTVGGNRNNGTAGGGRSATQSEADFVIGDGMPLLDQNAELMKNDLVLPGNRCLLSLNLSKNCITDTGVQHFLKSIQYQEMFIKLNISTRNPSSSTTPIVPVQGLLRLELLRNDFVPSECEAYEKVQTLLKNRREPIFKSKDIPEEPSAPTTGGRDTVGTPHSKSRTGLRH